MYMLIFSQNLAGIVTPVPLLHGYLACVIGQLAEHACICNMAKILAKFMDNRKDQCNKGWLLPYTNQVYHDMYM